MHTTIHFITLIINASNKHKKDKNKKIIIILGTKRLIKSQDFLPFHSGIVM